MSTAYQYLYPHNPISGSATQTVLTTSAVGLSNIPSGSTVANITVEGQVRYWIDGSTPSSTAGHLVSGGSIQLQSGQQVSQFKVIGVGASATIQVTYF